MKIDANTKPVKIRSNSKTWKVLADSCETPGDFLKCVMRIRGIGTREMANKLECSEAYICMIVGNSSAIATKACLKIANILDIDPYLLNRVASDYAMKKLIQQNDT